MTRPSGSASVASRFAVPVSMLAALASALALLGRYGTQGFALSIFLGLALPQFSAAARPLLGLPAGVVDGGSGFVGFHAAAPMRGSSISRSLLRLRNRWLLMVPSASPVMLAISPIGSSSR